jgi:hypothetical protein
VQSAFAVVGAHVARRLVHGDHRCCLSGILNRRNDFVRRTDRLDGVRTSG